MLPAISLLALHILAILILSQLYFRTYALKRPPIGVFNLWDVALMLVGILCIPYLYLLLPFWLVAVLLGLGAVGIGDTTLEPLIPLRQWRWLLLSLLVIVELFALRQWGAGSQIFLLINNLVQVLVVVGVSNLWAQCGMKARDCAILGAALTVYDLLFTSFLPLMGDLFHRLATLPFAPQIGWTVAGGGLFAIGVGDLLLAAVFPLLMGKAYGTKAGGIAYGLTAVALIALLLLPRLLPDLVIFPVMTVLGPLMVGQVFYWRRQKTSERTTWQFRSQSPFRT